MVRPADAANNEVTDNVFTKNNLEFNTSNGTNITGHAQVGGVLVNLGTNTIGGGVTSGLLLLETALA